MVVRRYIDFVILLIPTPLLSAYFLQQHSYFLFIFLNVFRSLYIYISIYISYVRPFCPAGGAKCKMALTRKVQM